MRFREVQPAESPLVVEDLQPEAFAETWRPRPRKPVQVGLRLPSEADEAYARMTAADALKELQPGEGTDIVQEYNTVLMLALLARSFCRATNVALPWELFPAPDERMIREALTAATIRRLFERLELAKLQYGNAVEEATDEEVAEVAELLSADGLAGLPRPDACLSRRLLKALAGLLQVDS